MSNKPIPPKAAEDIQQKILDRTAEHRRRHADTIQNAIFDGLVTRYEREKNVLPEHIFVRDFLPYFCGELKIEDNEQVIPMWCAVSGNPNNEVTILSSKGDKLFDVPALIDTSAINPRYNHQRGGPKTSSIDDISNQAELIGKSMPERGSLFFAEAFFHRAEMIKNQNFDGSEYQRRWMEIFERYGKIKKAAETATANVAPTSQVKSTITDDDLEF